MKIQLFFLTRILHYNVFVKKKSFKSMQNRSCIDPLLTKVYILIHINLYI